MKRYLMYYVLLVILSISIDGMHEIRPFKKEDAKSLLMFIIRNMAALGPYKKRGQTIPQHIKAIAQTLHTPYLLIAKNLSSPDQICGYSLFSMVHLTNSERHPAENIGILTDIFADDDTPHTEEIFKMLLTDVLKKMTQMKAKHILYCPATKIVVKPRKYNDFKSSADISLPLPSVKPSSD